MMNRQTLERRERASRELQTYRPSDRSQQVVDSLSAGLTLLRDLFLVRASDDVERRYGMDSMLGVSLANLQRQIRFAKIETEAYSCIIVNEEAVANGWVSSTDSSFLDWIFRLRLGEDCRDVMEQRVEHYQSRTVEERRLKYVSQLQRSTPQSARAPLVLFRLFPRSVRIVAAVAMGDPRRAQELRAEQFRLLPTINDCHACHGRVLDNEEVCRCCGNPLWNFDWLLAD